LACFGKILSLNLVSRTSEALKDEKGLKIMCEFKWK